MVYRELYRAVVAQLTAAGCDSPEFDACCLLTDVGGLPPRGLPTHDERPISPEIEEAVCSAAEQRAAGRPLQYILGEWDFLNLTLSVGEGVLIPRPDTERLCEVSAEYLDAHHDLPGRVLDLCAGSGCVGLGVSSLCRRPLEVTAVELSDDAFSYLQKNIARYPAWPVAAVSADVLRDASRFDGEYGAILSNPPYIPTADLPGLMREVQHEPTLALDGGEGEGLRFYRVIADEWTKKLAPGGLCAVEVGIHQASAVAALFAAAGLRNVRVFDDYAGIPRVVCGEK